MWQCNWCSVIKSYEFSILVCWNIGIYIHDYGFSQAIWNLCGSIHAWSDSFLSATADASFKSLSKIHAWGIWILWRDIGQSVPIFLLQASICGWSGSRCVCICHHEYFKVQNFVVTFSELPCNISWRVSNILGSMLTDWGLVPPCVWYCGFFLLEKNTQRIKLLTHPQPSLRSWVCNTALYILWVFGLVLGQQCHCALVFLFFSFLCWVFLQFCHTKRDGRVIMF